VDLVDGVDLHWALDEYRRQGGLLPLTEASRLLDQLAGALDYIHTQGVIHRDVKPANILLDRHGRAVLTDFGVAIGQSETRPRTPSGSARYAAPEQILPGGSAVPQSDIYSLGVILYEMLTGSRPFEGEGALSVALKHLHEPPPQPSSLNPGVPPGLEAVVLRALAKEPGARYATATALAEAFQQASKEAEALTLPARPRGQARSKQSLAEIVAQRPAPEPQPLAYPGALTPTGQANALRLAPWLGVLSAAILVALLRGGQPPSAAAIGSSEAALPRLIGGAPAAATAEVPTAPPASGEANVLMMYDDNTLTVLNTSDAPVSFAGVTFVPAAPPADYSASFSAAEWNPGARRVELRPGYCFRLMRFGGESPTPQECAFVQRWASTSDPRVRFWTSEAGPEFLVLQNETEVQRCGVAEGQCQFYLPPP
jgi:hypothetical protein